MRRSTDRASVRTTVVAMLAAVVAAGGCGPMVMPPAPPPVGPQPHSPRLPPIPRVDGPLELRVSYPREDAFVATRGNTFIFGSTGSGAARVWINGDEVAVQPNGGFLAYLPVPPDSVYRLRAELNGRTRTLEVRIRLPEAPPVPEPGARIVAASTYPTGGWVALPGERIEVGFRGSAGGLASLLLPSGRRIPLVQAPPPEGPGATPFELAPATEPTPAGPAAAAFADYRGFFPAERVVAADTAVAWPGLTGEPRPGAPEGVERPAGSVLELVVGNDTARHELSFNLLLADPERPRVGWAHDPKPPEQNGTRSVAGRPGPGSGPFHYIWRNGTELTLTGERDGIYRVRLTEQLDAWTPAVDIPLLPAGTPPPTSRVAAVRLDPQPGWIDVRVPLTRRLPYRVDESERTLSLTVYGATSRASFLQHGRVDPYIDRAEWSQPAGDVFRLDVRLTGLPWGYEVFHAGGDLVLRIRRPPAIDARRPLRRLVVGVDPGHGGADRFTMGPTGFTEADANLGIALALQDELRRRGARVVMTRTTDTTVSLAQRTDLARAENVDVWISVHNNAFPDGVNPWENNGTSVYYTQPRGAGLAWATQGELLAEFGLRDLGVGRADFHVTRFTWVPAILTENMFMMIPEQEAALRRPDVQRRVALATARGLERWLGELAER